MGVEGLEQRLVLSAMRIASWNVFDGPTNSTEDAFFETVLEAIGNEDYAGIAQPVDIMTLAEADTTNAGRIEDILDGLYGTTSYQFQLANADFGGDRTGFIYNTDTVQLVNSQQIISGMTHPALRGQFRPVGTTGDVDFYVYSIHLKAFGTGSDMAQREQEMQQLRGNADGLGEGANVILAGDFNLTGGSSEAAWSEAYSAGPGQLSDAADAPGNWNNNSSFKHLHTWSSGDLRSRLDLHMFSGELEDGDGLEYVPGSARPFGNNGTHTFSQSVTTGNGAAPNVLSALVNASDHLPLITDYEFNVAEVVVTESGGGTAVAEGGATDTYTVELQSIPVANVDVTLTPDAQIDLGSGAGNPVTLTFTPANAQTPMTVTVTAVDDLIQEGTQLSTITHSVSSADAAYNNLPVADVQVTVFDNEASSIVINEMDADTSGLDTLEFIEIYDGGVGNMPLDGLTLVLFDGSTDASYFALDLDGWATNAAGFFVAGNAGVTNVDLVFPNNTMQNGADAIGLYLANASDFPLGTSVTSANLIDAIVYDTDDLDDVGLLTLLNAGQGQVNENENGNRSIESLQRVPDGGAPLTTSTYVATSPTPGVTNNATAGGVIVDLLDGSVAVSEAGVTDSYEITLESVPTVNVVITLTPDTNLDLGAGQNVPISLTFTPANGLLAQTVTVAAYDDILVEGQHVGTISYTVSSGDLAYDGLFVADTNVDVTDDDQPALVINEVDADTVGTDMLEFVELFDGGVGNVPLDGYTLVFFNGNGDVQYAGFNLTGQTTNADGFFVLGNAAVANVDLVMPNSTMQNGADAVALYLGSAVSYPNVTTTNLIDAVVYDTDDGDDAGLLMLLNPGQPQLNERAGGNGTGHSNSRVPDGGVPRNTDTYVTQAPTPGAYNATPPAVDGDFDNDGDYDCADVDDLVSVIVAGGDPSAYDLTNDGLVDSSDLTAWLAEAGAANLASGNSYLVGDANLDGAVNGADFVIWNSNKFTTNPAWCAGDFNGDGAVNGADYVLWNSNKFTTADSVSVATPQSVMTPRSEVPLLVRDVQPTKLGAHSTGPQAPPMKTASSSVFGLAQARRAAVANVDEALAAWPGQLTSKLER